jgi:mRNA interferase RelE/StbE
VVNYLVKLRSSAQKDLDAITGKDSEAIANVIASFEKNPRPSKVKKLADSGLWRIRMKKYRIVYAVDDKAREVIIVRIARRSEDTYKGL